VLFDSHMGGAHHLRCIPDDNVVDPNVTIFGLNYRKIKYIH
jgi:hypothetical protein